ncbi:DUF3102 domain-containing protein [Bacillus pumilus]|uniref:DUF3102 domain-containing protein n=1 Tax=Bacillus TaxID=1386 RepID=UPI0011A027D5|nr:DUF3102 domain-containing protein [Bacillus pumilus]MCP1148050.1 DUF3102 domain-containing protein [Bacillus sp. 1735sda2]
MGRRLKHVKENDLVHGEWEKWCKTVVNISPGQARKFVTIAKKLSGTNRSTSNDLGLDVLYLIATIPEEKRDVSHQIPSIGETKTVDEMTVRELREVKNVLKEAEQDKKRLELELDEVKNMDQGELIEDLLLI